MALREIIESIFAYLPADIEVGIGGEASLEEGDLQAGRVVLVPGTVVYRTSQGAGIAVYNGVGRGTLTGQTPITQRQQAIEVRLSGADHDAVEALEEVFMNALQAVLGKSAGQEGAGRWLETDEQTRTGEELRFTFVVAIPVQKTAPLTRRPAFEPITPALATGA